MRSLLQIFVKDNTPLDVLPEDILTLSNNKWEAKFTINDHEQKALINGAPAVFKFIDVLRSNDYPGENENIIRILHQNRVLMDYYCESGWFPNHLSDVCDHSIEAYRELSPDEVQFSEEDLDPEGYNSQDSSSLTLIDQ